MRGVSSCIKTVTWRNATMRVKFKKGGTYIYTNVPLEEYLSFVGSESCGGYFNSNIRGHYDYYQKNRRTQWHVSK